MKVLAYLTINSPKVLVRNTKDMTCMSRELRYDFFTLTALFLLFKPATKKNAIVLLPASQVTGVL